MRDRLAAPGWSGTRGLRRFWFPFDTPGARAQALVHAPAAFRRRGVFVADYEIDAACEPTPLLDREGIEDAFRRLGDRLAKRGVARIGCCALLLYGRGPEPAHRRLDPGGAGVGWGVGRS